MIAQHHIGLIGIHHGPNQLHGLSNFWAAIQYITHKHRFAGSVAPNTPVVAVAQLFQQRYKFISAAMHVADDVVTFELGFRQYQRISLHPNLERQAS